MEPTSPGAEPAPNPNAGLPPDATAASPPEDVWLTPSSEEGRAISEIMGDDRITQCTRERIETLFSNRTLQHYLGELSCAIAQSCESISALFADQPSPPSRGPDSPEKLTEEDRAAMPPEAVEELEGAYAPEQGVIDDGPRTPSKQAALSAEAAPTTPQQQKDILGPLLRQVQDLSERVSITLRHVDLESWMHLSNHDLPDRLAEIRHSIHAFATQDGDISATRWPEVELLLLKLHLPQRWAEATRLREALNGQGVLGDQSTSKEEDAILPVLYFNPRRQDCVGPITPMEHAADPFCRRWVAPVACQAAEPVSVFFDTPFIKPETLSSYLPIGAPGQGRRQAFDRAMGSLNLNDDLSIKEFQFSAAIGVNCMSFAAGFQHRRTIIPGAEQGQDVRSTRSDPFPWMMDHHLKSQGCIRIQDVACAADLQLISQIQGCPYYLMAAIYANDDTHVMRCFYNQEQENLVWMESGGTKTIKFVQRADKLVVGLPANPGEAFYTDGWPNWLGYYLVPTHRVTFFDESGAKAVRRKNA